MTGHVRRFQIDEIGGYAFTAGSACSGLYRDLRLWEAR
jgi:hypothetical protein